MKKRLFSLLTSLFMVISMVSVLPAVTASALTYGRYTYYLLSDGTVIITKYNGSATSLSIPSTIDDRTVTSIGDDAFIGCESLTSVTIPNSVTSIGDYAFYSCESLTSITIPNSVTSIGAHAFVWCESLTSITVDSNNKNYSSENGVLFNKNKTELILYPIGNTRTSYTIPNTVKTIRSEAFYGCQSLTSITIPNSVTNIEGYAFYNCTSLTSINVEQNNNNSYSSENGVLFNKNKTELILYPIGNTRTSYTIPNTVKTIRSEAFYGCESLTSITIPNSVTSIEGYAFDHCTSLKDVYYIGSSTQWDKIAKSKNNSKLINANRHYCNHSYSYNSYIITKEPTCTENGVKTYICSICNDSYTEIIPATGHNYVITVVAPTCTEKGYTIHKCSVCENEYKDTYTNATGHKYELTTNNATLTENGSIIETCSECGDVIITPVYYPKTITLDNTSYLYDATVHKPIVTVIDENGDAISSDNYNVTYSDNCKDVGIHSVILEFVGNYSGKKTLNFEIYEPYNYTVENNTVKITKYIGSLQNITIPSMIKGKHVTSIGAYAFSNCKELTSVIIPDSVTSIEHYAFNGCNNLNSLKLGNGLQSIGNGAFYNCSSLESITIPANVTTIGERAFCGYKLTSISLPANIKHIGDKAFGYYYDNNQYWKNYGTLIKCYFGSLGEKYAINNGFDYQLVNGLPTVTGLKAAATTAQAVKLTCNKVTGATGYVFYRAVSGKWQRVGDSKTNTFTDTKLKSGTSYRYAVKAYKTVGGKNYYSASYPTLWTSTNPATVSFTVAGGVKKAVLKWSKTNGATGYKVYYKTSAKGKWVGLTTTKSLTYTKTGLVKGKTYWFTVKAYRTANGTTYNSTFVTKSVKVK